MTAVEAPRERLLRAGPGALSDAELLAVLLRGGRAGGSATDLAADLLAQAGGLPGLAGACARSLRRNGVARGRIAAVLAAAEIACRMAAAKVPERAPFDRLGDVARYVGLRYWRRDQEVAGALYLCGRRRLLGERELFRGTIDRTSVEPRAVLREALLRGAAAFVFFHTHPSGDPAPAREDLDFTWRLVRAGEAMGIELIDHLIVGEGGRWESVKQRGGWQLAASISIGSVSVEVLPRKPAPRAVKPAGGAGGGGGR